jgi:ferredoxin
MAPVVDRDKCKGCGTCIEFCPSKAIMMKDGKAYVTIDCEECRACVDQCPSQALH